MNKHPFKATVLFSFLVFLILTITMALMALLTMTLLNLGIIHDPMKGLIFLISGAVSVFVGTLFSRFAGKRPLSSIFEINEATKEVVKGNYNVRLDEDTPVAELSSMARNFNVMVKELENTEIFRKDFIENVSHEFKTPLSAIEGYVMLLQKKSLSEEKRAEYTERILLNTRRLSSLTGNILLLARLENQDIAIKKEPYSLDEQLREVILLFETQWTQKDLELDIDLCPADYSGNKELLMHVWQNILGNAIKFVSPHGKIQILLRKEQKSFKVSIADNGIGMDDETKKRVYEKFYQADSSRTGAGNGLGLTLAKRIVDLHGGTIEVSSKAGEGTLFAVTLPEIKGQPVGNGKLEIPPASVAFVVL